MIQNISRTELNLRILDESEKDIVFLYNNSNYDHTRRFLEEPSCNNINTVICYVQSIGRHFNYCDDTIICNISPSTRLIIQNSGWRHNHKIQLNGIISGIKSDIVYFMGYRVNDLSYKINDIRINTLTSKLYKLPRY